MNNGEHKYLHDTNFSTPCLIIILIIIIIIIIIIIYLYIILRRASI